MLPVVVVHGGAGQIPKDRAEGSMSGVCSAARAGYGVLLGGGSSVDAVVEAVSLMENNPAFNAGNAFAHTYLGLSAIGLGWQTFDTLGHYR